MSTPARPIHRSAPAAAAALAIGLGLAALSGCGGGDSGASSDAGPPAANRQSEPAAGGTSGGAAADQQSEAADGSKAAAPVAGAPAAVSVASYDRKLARRADIAITVKDVDAAAAQVRAITASAKGLVIAEAISSEPDDPRTGGFSTITVSVPTDSLDATLDRLSELGKVHSRNTSTDDVTGQYVDTEARVRTMQASVDRVRALMSRATKLGDIVSLEAELSRRQADLESTQSQLAALKDSVALAPIEVRLSTDEQVLQAAEADTGFLAGLRAGWAAFAGSVTVLLTVLGALLPFLVVLAVVLVPLVLWWRRRTPRRPVTVQTALQPPPAA